MWHRSLCGARACGKRWACEIDLWGARAARPACAALCAAAGGRRRSFVGGDLAMPAIAGEFGPGRSSVPPTRHSPPHGDIRVVPGWWPLTALGLARAPNRVAAPAALNDQRNWPAYTQLLPLSRTRGTFLLGAGRRDAGVVVVDGAGAADEVRGRVTQHPGSTTALR